MSKNCSNRCAIEFVYAHRFASVARTAADVIVTREDGPRERFDEVVIAAHADQALRMLADATRSERQILSAFPYQPNEAVLHADTRQLATRRRAWASWNFHIPAGDDQSASVTYDLSRLQNHDASVPILLTLIATDDIASETVLRTFSYHYPAYSSASISAQRSLQEISGRNRTHFCGDYWGYGFHEDGVNSALACRREPILAGI